jgi:hypothetical protein
MAIFRTLQNVVKLLPQPAAIKGLPNPLHLPPARAADGSAEPSNAGAFTAGTGLKPMSSKAFHHFDLWRIAAPPEKVFAKLADVSSYGQWWKGMSLAPGATANQGTIDGGELSNFKVKIENTCVDAKRGIVEARLKGDVAGQWRWVVKSDGKGGSLVHFEESANTNKGWLNSKLNLLAQGGATINHAIVMAKGQSGLSDWLQTH